MNSPVLESSSWQQSAGRWRTLFSRGPLLCVGLVWSYALPADSNEYITTHQPTVLMSVNDGESNSWAKVAGQSALTEDSVTRIRLFRDQPPIIDTVYGTTSSTIWGAAYAAILGRYAIITNHDYRMGEIVAPEVAGQNQILALDLESDDLKVTSRIYTEARPWLALPHPDGKRVIVALSDHWRVLEIDSEGSLVEISRSPTTKVVYAFDVSSDGRTILATAMDSLDSANSPSHILRFSIDSDSRISLDGEITSEKYRIDGPFAPRISPNGGYALVLNSLGDSDGVLDDVLVVNLADNSVSGVVAQVADGLESLAFHPSGTFAVISCLNYFGPMMTSHLAVIDLQGDSARLLYHLPVEQYPEGIEFTPDGEMLFVGSTQANHIAVFEVAGKRLIRSPYVIPTGNGHALLGIRTD